MRITSIVAQISQNLEAFKVPGQQNQPAQNLDAHNDIVASSNSSNKYTQAAPAVMAQLKAPAQAPAQNAAQQWLAKNPGANAQDIINWGYKNGGGTYAGAAKYLKQFGLDIGQLTANRQAPASGFIGSGSSTNTNNSTNSTNAVGNIENRPGMAGNAQQVIDFFMSKGLTREQAAGIAANIQSESNYNPGAVGDGGTSFGICQWHNNRGDNMKAWTQANGYDPKSFKGQLEFLWHEMNTSYPGVLNDIKGAKSAYDAAYAFCTKFEIPANKEQVGATRGKLAEQILANNKAP